MQNEVNVQRSKLLDDGMLHIELLDGNSYLYSLQELADIIAAQQRVQADAPLGKVSTAQIFEVTWSEGTVTRELISSLLRQYVTQGGLYGTVVVKEATQ